MNRDNWQLFVAAINKDVCNSLVNEFMQIDPIDGTVYSAGNDHRKSKVRWVHGRFDVEDLLLRFVHEANAVAFNVDIQPEMREMQFTEYEASYGGKYDWHHDINWENHKNYDRKLSMVVQLSDPDTYEGGMFEFMEVQMPKHKDWKQQGSILIFPSYLQHRVTEVTKGTRYSLVSWVRGPRWK